VRRQISKQLTCPACGDIIAAAVYTRWLGNLVLTSTEGSRIQPEGGAVQVRRAQHDLSAGSPADRAAVQDRLDFLNDHLSELIYDLRCRRGHSTLRTAPQIVRAMRRTPGDWVATT
jgi:RNA polymerase subunit RPABC4/transcription elongation factor Spt4